MYLVAALFAFLSVLLSRERAAEIVGWFSDRDDMTTWCDGVIWTIAYDHYATLMPRHKELAQIVLGGEAPRTKVGPRGLWYDEFIRPADYLAGIFGSWQFQARQIPSGEKYHPLAEHVVADADNLVALGLEYAEKVGFSHIWVRKQPFPP